MTDQRLDTSYVASEAARRRPPVITVHHRWGPPKPGERYLCGVLSPSRALWAPKPRLSNRAELEALATTSAEDVAEVQAKFAPDEHPFSWVPREQAEASFENDE
jgi:hypothetical protein